jgi:two-component system, OmpR family, sensor kinase
MKTTIMLRSLFWKIFAVILITDLFAMSLTVYFLMPPSEPGDFAELRKELRLNMAKTIIGRVEAGQSVRIFLPDRYAVKGPVRGRFMTEGLLILDHQDNVIFGKQQVHNVNPLVFIDYQSDTGRYYRIGIENSQESTVFEHLIKPRQTVRFIILFLATIVVSFIISWLIIRPLKQLGKHARSLSEGNMHSRVEQCLLNRYDEIGVLSRELNEMANTLDNLINSKQQLLHDVSHELRAPLSRLQAITAIMQQQKKTMVRDMQQLSVSSVNVSV